MINKGKIIHFKKWNYLAILFEDFSGHWSKPSRYLKLKTKPSPDLFKGGNNDSTFSAFAGD